MANTSFPIFASCFGMRQEAVNAYLADTSGSRQKPIPGSNHRIQDRISFITHENLVSGLLKDGLRPAAHRFEKFLGQSLHAADIGHEWEEVADMGKFFEQHLGAVTNVVPSSMTLALHIFRFYRVLASLRTSLSRLPKSPSIEELETIPLLLSLYAETLRFGVQIHIPRSAPYHELHIGEVTIPRNKLIMTNTWLMHTDENLWNTKGGEHPLDQFWAERFLVDPEDERSGPVKQKADPSTENKPEKQVYFSVAGLEGAWIPYGGGQHACPGRLLAKRIMLISAAMLVNNFDIEILANKEALNFDSPRFGFGNPIIGPHFYKDEVDILPYNIPCHAISMFKDTAGLYDRAYAYFGHTRKPYALHVAGKQIVIITHPKHMAEIFKDDDNFSFDPFIDLVYRGVGNVSEAANVILWRKPSEGFTSLHPNPKQNVLVHTGNALLHKQILTPGGLHDLLGKVVTYIDQKMRWDAFFPTTVISDTHDTKVVSLHRWCRDVLIEAQTRVFFGPYLHELEPNYTTIFDQWDINSWMITYQYPAFLCKAATVPREKLVKAWTAYLDAPREKRAGGVAFVNELEDEMRHAGLGSEDCARVLMIILWGINSNVQMTAFWMMVNILPHPSLVTAIRDEIKPLMAVIASKGFPLAQADVPDIFRNHMIDSCPLLSSLFDEIIRFYSTGASVRQTMQPVKIDGKQIPVCTKLLLPQRQLLVAPEAFGKDAHVVNPERFLRRKDLGRHEYYRPFGGGITLCSGKTVGRYEVLSFVAFALWRYDCEVILEGGTAVDGTKGMAVPEMALKKPSLGISKQVEGHDMIVTLKKREARTVIRDGSLKK
ncbi:hypothetical protein DL769_003297 [Monosporascus sp. CRB-8-3]|nr:hypothetical protein DL769_003297 [Monosporascus sp. CRB-8-3]